MDDDSVPRRQDDPDKLWEMINERDKVIRELKGKGGEHWYDANSGIGDNHKYHCKCGFSWHSYEKLESHIAWKRAQLGASRW